VVSFLQVFQPKFCMHFSCLPVKYEKETKNEPACFSLGYLTILQTYELHCITSHTPPSAHAHHKGRVIWTTLHNQFDFLLLSDNLETFKGESVQWYGDVWTAYNDVSKQFKYLKTSTFCRAVLQQKATWV
jgi:hypothetical protein